MIEWLKKRFGSQTDNPKEEDHDTCVEDLMKHKLVKSMNDFMQHGETSTLEHSLNVSYYSYKLCKKLGLDYRSAARGGLLHDFFLYDWHENKPYKGFHGLLHPYIALKNAGKHFDLNKKEKDIIKKHMWPVTLSLPRYKESFVVLLVDKYCALAEVMIWRQKSLLKLKYIMSE